MNTAWTAANKWRDTIDKTMRTALHEGNLALDVTTAHVLLVLSETSGTTVPMIAAALGVTRSQAHMALHRLHVQAHVTNEPVNGWTHWSLTPQGQETAARARTVIAAAHSQIILELTQSGLVLPHELPTSDVQVHA